MFTENLEVGHTFKKWPLHLTLIAWFRLDKAEVEQDLTSEFAMYKPIHIEAIEEGRSFGHQPGKHATVLTQDLALMTLEKTLRKYLKSRDAWLVDETTKLPRQFMPHITVQGKSKVHQGDHFVFDYVYVVKQLGDSKLIEAAIKLGS